MNFTSQLFNRSFLLIFYTGLMALALFPKPLSAESIVLASYESSKDRLLTSDRSQRTVLGSLYQTSKRIKKMSHRRTRIRDELIATDSRVRDLARDIVNIEESLSSQKRKLSLRLKSIYKSHSDGGLNLIFGAISLADLEQRLTYLRAFAKEDRELITSYSTNLVDLREIKVRIQKKVAELLHLRASLAKEERALQREQTAKQKILTTLRQRHSKYLNQMLSARGELGTETDMSFFEKKGQLPPPVSGDILRAFGWAEESERKFGFYQKGILFMAGRGQDLRAIHGGRVSFSGYIPGYGATLILDHGDHFFSVYAPVREPLVPRGSKVEPEAVIARVGEGLGGLYFEIRHFSDPVDPAEWFRTEERKQL